MSDDIGIEVRFDRERGHLLLTCGEEEFARLRDLVFAEAFIPEIVGPHSAEAWLIEIESVQADLAHHQEAHCCPGRLLVRLAILAVTLVFFVGLGTILFGVWQLLHWVMQRLA